MRDRRLKGMMLSALFAALIAVGAFIKVPIGAVPFTLQTFFVGLAGLLLQKRIALTSCLVYIAIGLAGLPVFAAGGGIGYVLQPTFGYMVGFALGAYVEAAIIERAKKQSFLVGFIAAAAGLFCIYALGTAYYAFMMNAMGTSVPLGVLLVRCVFTTLPGDALCAVLCALIYKRLRPFTIA